MISHFTILILSIIGLCVSLYLNYEHKRKRPPVCVIGSDCDTVWMSPYSRTFGVSNEVYGIVFYITVAVIEGTFLWGAESFFTEIGEYLVLAVGFLMSCYFVFLQCRVIRAWCFWCTLSAVITCVMLLVKLVF